MSDQKVSEQGERDFYSGKDPNDNPYPRESAEHEDWKRGNDNAYDEYRERHKDWYGDR